MSHNAKIHDILDAHHYPSRGILIALSMDTLRDDPEDLEQFNTYLSRMGLALKEDKVTCEAGRHRSSTTPKHVEYVSFDEVKVQPAHIEDPETRLALVLWYDEEQFMLGVVKQAEPVTTGLPRTLDAPVEEWLKSLKNDDFFEDHKDIFLIKGVLQELATAGAFIRLWSTEALLSAAQTRDLMRGVRPDFEAPIRGWQNALEDRFDMEPIKSLVLTAIDDLGQDHDSLQQALQDAEMSHEELHDQVTRLAHQRDQLQSIGVIMYPHIPTIYEQLYSIDAQIEETLMELPMELNFATDIWLDRVSDEEPDMWWGELSIRHLMQKFEDKLVEDVGDADLLPDTNNVVDLWAYAKNKHSKEFEQSEPISTLPPQKSLHFAASREAGSRDYLIEYESFGGGWNLKIYVPRQHEVLPDGAMCDVHLTGLPDFIESLYIGSTRLEIKPDEYREYETKVSLGALRAQEDLSIMLITRRPDGTGRIYMGSKKLEEI